MVFKRTPQAGGKREMVMLEEENSRAASQRILKVDD